jgi:hypothetical protein
MTPDRPGYYWWRRVPGDAEEVVLVEYGAAGRLGRYDADRVIYHPLTEGEYLRQATELEAAAALRQRRSQNF